MKNFMPSFLTFLVNDFSLSSPSGLNLGNLG